MTVLGNGKSVTISDLSKYSIQTFKTFYSTSGLIGVYYYCHTRRFVTIRNLSQYLNLTIYAFLLNSKIVRPNGFLLCLLKKQMRV